jgi:hypothetical protein
MESLRVQDIVRMLKSEEIYLALPLCEKRRIVRRMLWICFN